MSNFSSLNLESHTIAGILQYPKIWPDIALSVDERDFRNEHNKVIFKVMKKMLDSGDEPDPVIICQKIDDLKIRFTEEINIYSYLEGLKLRQITEKNLINTAKDLRLVSIRRDIYRKANQVMTEIKNAGGKSLSEILSIPDSIFNSDVNLYDLDNEPRLLFEGIEEEIEELGNNPVEEVGLIPPYPIFQRMFGGFTDGDIYVFASPKKHGKSTLLFDLMDKVCHSQNENVKGLMLDTELETYRVRYRAVASHSNINEWYIKTGNWRKNKDMTEAVRDRALPRLKKSKNIHHIYVGGKPIDEVCSIIRRWKKKHVKPGEKAIICYDYIKLTGEKLSESFKEYQAIGEKVDRLKQIATEIQAPVLAACQTNEEGGIALSSRIAWFCSFMAFFRKKDIEEIAEHGINNGTHKMIPYVARNLGKDGDSFVDVVKVKDSRGKVSLTENYINFEINNFSVKELHTLKDIIDGQLETKDDLYEDFEDHPFDND